MSVTSVTTADAAAHDSRRGCPMQATKRVYVRGDRVHHRAKEKNISAPSQVPLDEKLGRFASVDF
jgi:hypothetical protein